MKSIAEVEPIWYKVLKLAIGVIFNIKASLTEIILGVSPIIIANQINSVKHYLKVNIFRTDHDQLRRQIDNQLEEKSHKVTMRVKDVYQFLLWKLKLKPNDFTEDVAILKANNLEKFSSLSMTSCSYTKSIINAFTEKVWQDQTNSQFQLDGYNVAPKVYIKKLRLLPPLN